MSPDKKGQLKIFFSYAESIGKTQAMLLAAQTAAARGTDVVVGFVAPHTTDTERTVLEGLEVLPHVRINGGEEFDLDGALRRHPQLIVVDELAHTNSRSCRHRCRYQDIWELQKAGIDVYTTVNLGNIESLHDTVAAITGTSQWERIPDSVFDHADQVELIDIEPEDLLTRRSPSETITIQQLTALRELALRRCADRVGRLSDRLPSVGVSTGEHILACLSSAPTNGKIIRTAARMARAFNSQFTALFIKTPDFEAASQEDKQRLQENQKLAQQLGANIEMVFGDDVPYQIAEFARLSGVTKIVLGRSAVTRKHLFGKPTLTEQLLSYVPEIDIHIIPDWNVDKSYQPKQLPQRNRQETLRNLGISGGILAAVMAVSLLMNRWGATEANFIMIFLLGVLVSSLWTSRRCFAMGTAAISGVLFSLLFAEPKAALSASITGHLLPVLVMLLTAYITSSFAISYREQAGQSAKIAYRTKILFDTDQLLSKVKNKEDIFEAAAQQILKLLSRNLVLFPEENGQLSEPHLFPINGKTMDYEDAGERKIAQWVLKNNHAAGATTDTLSDSRYLYLAVRVNEKVYAVIGIDVASAPLDPSEHSILLSILGECALALENEKNAREKEEAAILAEREQLRANLLRTISHDLRTPLTTISGNASNLISNGSSFDEATKQHLYQDIYDDSMWLINLVENLLSATRIEEGRMTLHTSTELLDDIVEESVRHVRRNARSHSFQTDLQDNFLLVKADAKLIMQVIVNIMDNAVKYTPAGSSVVIRTGQNEKFAEIRISDNGPGMSREDKQKIFEKFYCGANKIADNRRSLGLGLYLCKAIVEAHGGTISVADAQPHGTVFTFTLPVEEVTLHE